MTPTSSANVLGTDQLRILLRFWYRFNCDVFATTEAMHLGELDRAIAGSASRYIIGLSRTEAEIYQELPDQSRKEAFRIKRDLARRRQGSFFLGSGNLAKRLGGMEDMKAWRMLRWFERMDIIRSKSRGKKRSLGQRGEAAEFEWLLAIEAEQTPSPALSDTPVT